MPASGRFFGQRSAQAVLKHGLLTRYAHYFAGRAGAATQGRVAFIDGYAGEGRYEDGSPGSPLLLASEATRVEMFRRTVKLAFVEQDAARRERLRRSLHEDGIAPDQLLGGNFEELVDVLLDRYAKHAVLIFVDPFGLAVGRQTLERVLRRSSRRQPIDVLYHFSLLTVARMGRAAVVPGPTSERNAKQLDDALGSVEWRDEFRSASGPNAPTAAALTVAERFGRSVGKMTGIRSTAVPVRQRPGQLAKYLLMLFSADERAHWDFVDQAGNAYIGWLHYCDREDYDANMTWREQHGVQELFAPAEPNRDDIEEQLRREAATYLPGRLRNVLERRRLLRPVDALEDVYGDMFGRARAMHVRAALKVLHKAGCIDDDGAGDFCTRTIRWIEGDVSTPPS